MHFRPQACVGLVVLSLLTATSAQASIVNYSTFSDLDLGSSVIPIGQRGAIAFTGTEIFIATNPQAGGVSFSARIPAHSKLVLSYSLPDSGIETIIMSTFYRYSQGNYQYGGFNNQQWGTPINNQFSLVNEGFVYNDLTQCCGWMNGQSLIFATADIAPDTHTGTTTLINMTGGWGAFSNLLGELKDRPFVPTTVTYAVTSVPLPASLPMSLVVLAMFAAVQFRKQQRNGSAQ